MPRLKYSLLAVAGIVLLAVVLSVIGPKRALAALGYTPIMDVENPGLHPFQKTLFIGGRDGFPLDSNLFRVPVRQRLVIDTIDGVFSTAIAPLDYVQLDTYVNESVGLGTPHFFPVTFTTTDGFNLKYVMTQHVQLYADPGTLVRFSMSPINPPYTIGKFNISGHLVDIP